MPELSKRRKWIEIAVMLLLVALLAGIANPTVERSGPSPEQARAALAESRWCKPDAPIIECNGKVCIGGWECDLKRKTWMLGIFVFHREAPDWLPRPDLLWPFGRWIAVCLIN